MKHEEVDELFKQRTVLYIVKKKELYIMKHEEVDELFKSTLYSDFSYSNCTRAMTWVLLSRYLLLSLFFSNFLNN